MPESVTLEKRKKEEMIPNLLAKPLERPIKTNDPLESPTLPKARKGGRSEAGTRCTRDARNERPLFESLFNRGSFISYEPNADIRRRFAAIKLVEENSSTG